MKNYLIIFCILISFNKVFAQNSTIKAGANFNADIKTENAGRLNHLSYEISYEKILGKKFSISAGYNYAQFNYQFTNEYRSEPYHFKSQYWTDYKHTLFIEGRYYFKSNSEGIFMQVGLPLTYTDEKINLDVIAPTFHRHYYGIGTFVGAGIKYPFNSKCGLEMNININPSENFFDKNYRTLDVFVKSGFKLFWLFDSKK